MVYLLHLNAKFGHTQHYIGCVKNEHNLKPRIQCHRSGNGARYTQAAMQVGIGFVLVRVWKDGDRDLERRLKRQKHGPRLCPICNAEHWQSRADSDSSEGIVLTKYQT